VPENYTSFHFDKKFQKEIYLWHYTGVIRKAIISLKYKFARQVARELNSKIISLLKKRKIIFPRNSVLVPIPTSFQRKNWRGFNQTELIGRVIAAKFKIGFEPNLLLKKHNTSPQTQLTKGKRIINLNHCFELNPDIINNMSEKTIILFDDVLTTGSTILEAERVLSKSYNGKIQILILASQ
jgi:ComF family protein